MAEGKETVKTKPVPTRRYASCPLCSATLVQAEMIVNAVIKCETCHQLIRVDIDGGQVAVKKYVPAEYKK